MKKMAFELIFILVVIVFVFAGCVGFSNSIGSNGKDEPTGEQVDTTDEAFDLVMAEAMDIPVTDAAGQAVTNAAGEPETTRVFVRAADLDVTDAAGQVVTNAAGQPETTRVYFNQYTGEPVTGGEIVTVPAYRDKITGTVSEEKPAQPGVLPSDVQTDPTLPPITVVDPVTTPSSGSTNEFDFLKSGNFYLKGTMTDSTGMTQPLEMAVTPNSMFMLSEFEGANMGMLINNGTAYMIYTDKQAYLELSSVVLKFMDMDTNDLLASSDLDYAKYDLGKADATATEAVNGANCNVYIFNTEFGSTRFYMNGSKLVRMASFDTAGNPESISDIEMITGTVPADKINPPTNFQAYTGITGMFSFIALLSDVMQ